MIESVVASSSFPPPKAELPYAGGMMATDQGTSTRGDLARESGTGRTDVAERERNLEARREGTTRRGVARRTPYFGTMSSPFNLMRRMADDIERLFSDYDYGRVGFGLQSPRAGNLDPWRVESRLAEASWVPLVETFRKGGNIVVRADLPGLTKDDIDVEIDDDVLTIAGERSDETRDERDDFYRTERSYGRFFRAIPLPEGVEADKIDATFKDGVLEVTIPAPKVTTPKNRQVKIR
jgi:HSP20 family protein